ncbi:hypothetical protein GH714_000442 [Hevea brasiliensis]|uniref:Leucine-rich repeat-containing N-terminal plant-type domain-containing protein n=1 Tax=Hevea brasiliensis TaxID=3981 RepID=A0A6A6L820_HEVBR|nr:hypothetical protein GH714_000442 [Hevea brasiliensis]
MVIARTRSLQYVYVLVTVLLFLVHIKPSLHFKHGCIEREKKALLRMKDDLIDDYGVLSSWGREEDKRDCCKWRGIACSNRTGHVIEIALTYEKPLRGKISNSLLELRHLTYLDLSGNDYGVTQFPADNNGSLSKLRHLDLHNANFAGAVSSLLANLSSLVYLDLSKNHFHDLENIDWLLGLSSLSYLDLGGNSLVRPSDWLQIVNKLPQLETLSLSSCFSGDGIPLTLSPINYSSSLTTLDISYNNLVIPSIYPWLSNISRYIEKLTLSSNLLQGSTLAEIGNMISLQELYLSNATIVGPIPKSFGNMSDLHFLDLSDNNISVPLPDLIQNLSGYTEKSLVTLRLDGNQLTDDTHVSQPNIDGRYNQEDKDEFWKWFYAGMGLGFTVGFWEYRALYC